MALDERRVQAIEVLAQSMNSFYSKDAKEKESFVSVCEEKTVYFQNKLIEAYEKKENLTNRMAKDILDDQISFYKKKTDELKEIKIRLSYEYNNCCCILKTSSFSANPEKSLIRLSCSSN